MYVHYTVLRESPVCRTLVIIGKTTEEETPFSPLLVIVNTKGMGVNTLL